MMADVRWGRVGETSCRFAAHLDLTEGGGELAAMAQGSRVVVLVPARHVALRQTTFQARPGRRRRWRWPTPMRPGYWPMPSRCTGRCWTRRSAISPSPASR
ncbi:hypothetical protein M5585_25540 [Serratia ureilytica]